MEVKSEAQLFLTSIGSKVMGVKRSNFPMHSNGTFCVKISKCTKIGTVVDLNEYNKKVNHNTGQIGFNLEKKNFQNSQISLVY